MFNIMQGDEYGIPFQIKTTNGTATPDLFDDVEIMIDDVRKTMKNGEVTFNEKTGEFIFPLKQTDCMNWYVGVHTAQIRVKYKNGDVIGISIDDIDVQKSRSKEVL